MQQAAPSVRTPIEPGLITPELSRPVPSRPVPSLSVPSRLNPEPGKAGFLLYPTLPGSAIPAEHSAEYAAFWRQSRQKVAILHYPGSGLRDGTERDGNGTGRERDGTDGRCSKLHLITPLLALRALLTNMALRALRALLTNMALRALLTNMARRASNMTIMPVGPVIQYTGPTGLIIPASLLPASLHPATLLPAPCFPCFLLPSFLLPTSCTPRRR